MYPAQASDNCRILERMRSFGTSEKRRVRQAMRKLSQRAKELACKRVSVAGQRPPSSDTIILRPAPGRLSPAGFPKQGRAARPARATDQRPRPESLSSNQHSPRPALLCNALLACTPWQVLWDLVSPGSCPDPTTYWAVEDARQYQGELYRQFQVERPRVAT